MSTPRSWSARSSSTSPPAAAPPHTRSSPRPPNSSSAGRSPNSTPRPPPEPGPPTPRRTVEGTPRPAARPPPRPPRRGGRTPAHHRRRAPGADRPGAGALGLGPDRRAHPHHRRPPLHPRRPARPVRPRLRHRGHRHHRRRPPQPVLRARGIHQTYPTWNELPTSTGTRPSPSSATRPPPPAAEEVGSSPATSAEARTWLYRADFRARYQPRTAVTTVPVAKKVKAFSTSVVIDMASSVTRDRTRYTPAPNSGHRAALSTRHPKPLRLTTPATHPPTLQPGATASRQRPRSPRHQQPIKELETPA